MVHRDAVALLAGAIGWPARAAKAAVVPSWQGACVVALRRIDVMPTTRSPEGRWSADPALDAFLSAARGVCEALSAELPAADLSCRRSWLEFYVRRADGERAVAEVARSHDASFGDGNLYVPERFARLSREEAASAALDVLRAALGELGVAYGWPLQSLVALHDRVRGEGLRYAWRSPWKAGPGREHEASCVYRIADDGLGRAQLEVRRRGESDVLARTREGLACGTAKALRASAATLRWQGPGSVSVVPWVDLSGHQDDRLEVLLEQPMVAPLVTDPPVPAQRAFPTATVRVHHGALAYMDDEARRDAVVWLHEGGAIFGYKVRAGHVWATWARAVSAVREVADGAAWLAPSRFVSLIVVIEIDRKDVLLSGATEVWHDAVGDHLLSSLTVDAARLNALTEDQRHADLVEMLKRHLEHVAGRRKLGPPPWQATG